MYYVHGHANAARLPASVAEPVKVQTLWKANVKGGGYGFSSPVIHEGLLYSANDQGILTAVEIATGKVVYEERLNHDGTTYPSLSVAGNRLYASSDKGTTVVLQLGREFKVLARSKLELFRSSLVFDGKRVYIRRRNTFTASANNPRRARFSRRQRPRPNGFFTRYWSQFFLANQRIDCYTEVKFALASTF